MHINFINEINIRSDIYALHDVEELCSLSYTQLIWTDVKDKAAVAMIFSIKTL